MNNLFRLDTNTIENIKGEIRKMQEFLDDVDSKISQCNVTKQLNIELENIELIKENIKLNIANLENMISNVTNFTNNTIQVDDYLTQSLRNLRTAYQNINI